MNIFVGCAGWNLRKEFSCEFSSEGSHLSRYASRFNCVEINSSFYRSHREGTYRRWADATPDNFRFSVKIPKLITHVHRLQNVRPLLEQFTAESSGLGMKLGPALIQLPPSLAFNEFVAAAFFGEVRSIIQAGVVCEPRHASWITPEAEAVMDAFCVTRVVADPPIVLAAHLGPSGTNCYFRLHGAPRTYYSSYGDESLADLCTQLRSAAKTCQAVWCVFDNTAEGAATTNALAVTEMLTRVPAQI